MAALHRPGLALKMRAFYTNHITNHIMVAPSHRAQLQTLSMMLSHQQFSLVYKVLATVTLQREEEVVVEGGDYKLRCWKDL